jgi:hypothetical protein
MPVATASRFDHSAGHHVLGACEIILTRLFAYIFTHHQTALAVLFAVFGLG